MAGVPLRLGRAIFIGCCSVTTIPKLLPNQRLSAETGTRTIRDSLAARRNSSWFRPRRRCQHDTPNTRTAATVIPASIVCPNAHSAHFAVSVSHTLVSSARFSTT